MAQVRAVYPVFSPIMRMDNYFITVNSEQYIEDYANRFKISKTKLFVLNDPVQSKELIDYKFTQSYIFAGGEAKRDWETLFNAAYLVPEIKFICIARRKYFNFKRAIPSNIELLFDTDNKTFYKYMEASSIVVIPLKTELPSGLIILLRASLMNKPVIATKTPAISNYITNGKSGLLYERNNAIELANAIKKLYSDEILQRKYSSNLLNHILNNHSQTQYASSIMKIIEEIEYKVN